MLVDAYLTYQFLKKLVTPFDKTEAYRRGLIDADGNFLRKRSDFNSEDKRALGLFDVLIFNLKKLIAKMPAGKSRIGTIAAAMFLLKSDPKRLKEETITDELFTLEASFNKLVEEVESMDEDAIANVTAGIAGLTPDTLGVRPRAARKYKNKNTTDTLNLIRRINVMKQQQLQK